MKITVIDGQGGKLGSMLIGRIIEKNIKCDLTAVGTNSIATASMIKAGAEKGATGENPVLVSCRNADVIVGPIGIVVADSLGGEVTPAMAVAVGQSRAAKVLLPVNRCENYVVGTKDMKVSELISGAVDYIISLKESDFL